jgi:hypothetical protein
LIWQQAQDLHTKRMVFSRILLSPKNFVKKKNGKRKNEASGIGAIQNTLPIPRVSNQ